MMTAETTGVDEGSQVQHVRREALGPTDGAPDIRDLAVIGDRRTAAVLDRLGGILWYCPRRFDQPSLLAALLDPKGGAWKPELPDARPGDRRYIGDSGVLETRLQTERGDWRITDFMPVGHDVPTGLLCRQFSSVPKNARILLEPRPDYARREAGLTQTDDASVLIDATHYLYASHPLVIEGSVVSFTLPEGEEGWAVLSDERIAPPDQVKLASWLAATLEYWADLSGGNTYSGPYEREVRASLRAIRLLSHEPSGGIVAAATTSLPELPGGDRNYDYRYVWLRDAGMIVSALTRLDGNPAEGERYLDFVCTSRGSSSEYPVAVFTTLDGEAAPEEEILEFEGYLGSRPVRIGNAAKEQMQLDAFGNVILAAKLIYRISDRRPHRDAVEEIADFLVEHWREPDHGIWEEQAKRQYTASKVIAACALESAAAYANDQAQAERWRAVVDDIRAFVASSCLTSGGAYAVFAGSEEVDVTAALFPVWAYTQADSPEMLATMAVLERDWSWQGLLYWRRLENAASREEGAFLACTFWVAQYWVMRGELERARRILDAGLEYANDLGLLAEEADPHSGRMLGNIPQTFAHAAFIGAVVDLKAASESQQSSS
jgi:GH15 family glucan-1,4-alpha-glucosidase